MDEKLKKYILDGEFGEAKKHCTKIKEEVLEDELLQIAFDTGNIGVYLFAYDLAYTKGTAELYSIASTLMSVVFNHLPGGYYVAYNHMLTAARLDQKDYTYKEGLLLFYHIPEKIIPREEALKISKEILLTCPDNKAANSVINEKCK